MCKTFCKIAMKPLNLECNHSSADSGFRQLPAVFTRTVLKQLDPKQKDKRTSDCHLSRPSLPVAEKTYLFRELYIEAIIRNSKKGRSFRLQASLLLVQSRLMGSGLRHRQNRKFLRPAKSETLL